jgi:hypothetical protein
MATSSANNKVIHGARCVVSVAGNPVGVFTSVSYGVNYSHQPIYILGKASAAEIAMTGMDVVTIQCHGWRVLGHGPFAGSQNTSANAASGSSSATPSSGGASSSGDSSSTGDVGMAKLQDVLSAGAVSVAIIDKSVQTGGRDALVMQVDQCRVVNFQSQLNAKQAQDFSVTFVGITYSDESGAQQDPSFSNLTLPG